MQDSDRYDYDTDETKLGRAQDVIALAIVDSICETRTAIVSRTPATERALAARVDMEDSVEVDGNIDAWGTRDDGEAWRLRLTHSWPAHRARPGAIPGRRPAAMMPLQIAPGGYAGKVSDNG